MRIIVVDDDAIVRTSLKSILKTKGYEVVAEGSDGLEAKELYESLHPDVLLMDIRMKEYSGLWAAKHVLAIDPDAKILLLTTFEDDEYIREAIELGCRGYLLKQNIAGITSALEAVLNDQLVYDSQVASRIEPRRLTKLPENLSDREKEVVHLVSQGLSNAEIAKELFLSEGTVRNYLSTILDKLELRDRTQLAIYYYTHKK